MRLLLNKLGFLILYMKFLWYICNIHQTFQYSAHMRYSITLIERNIEYILSFSYMQGIFLGITDLIRALMKLQSNIWWMIIQLL